MAFDNITGTTSNEFIIGNQTSVDGYVSIVANFKTSKPEIRTNNTSGKWEFSHDGTNFSNLESGIVIDEDITMAINTALDVGSRFGRVVLAPLGTSDWARVAAVYSACDGKYDLDLAKGAWDFTGAPSFGLTTTSGVALQDVPAGSTIVTTTRPTRINQASRETVQIMLCGDSITLGGDSNMTDMQVSYRGPLYEALRRVRGNVRFLGGILLGLYDNRFAIPGSNRPGNVTLGDWHASATGGYTLAQIATQTATDEGSQGLADIYVLLGGENDIGAGVTAGHTAAAICADVLAGIDAWIAARIAANPLAHIFVLDLTPHGVGLASYVARDAARALINAALPEHLAGLGHSNVHFVAAGSKLTKAHLQADGQHPDQFGFRIMANAIYNALIRTIGLGGQPHPRKVATRAAVVRRYAAVDYPDAAYVTDNGTEPCPKGTESVSLGMLHLPTDLGSDAVFTRNLMMLGPVGNYDLHVRTNKSYSGMTTANCVELYIAGVARFFQNDCLRVGVMHAIVVTFDNAKHEAMIYVLREGPDGRALCSCVSAYGGVPALNWAASPEARLGGYGGGGYAYSSQGLKGDFWIARNKIVSIDEVENWFNDGALPPGVTAHYPLNEGSGTVIHPSPAFVGLIPNGTTTNSWSAAGAVREKWHRYADSDQGGTFVLNGATGVDVACVGMLPGDERGITIVKSANGGTPGLPPLVVAGTDKFTVSAVALDTSTYAWHWRL